MSALHLVTARLSKSAAAVMFAQLTCHHGECFRSANSVLQCLCVCAADGVLEWKQQEASYDKWLANVKARTSKHVILRKA